MNHLDVRGLPPRDRFGIIMAAYEALQPGESLELTVDHDPECMYFTLLGTRGADSFGFEYRERGPVVWRVAVSKRLETAAAPPVWA